MFELSDAPSECWWRDRSAYRLFAKVSAMSNLACRFPAEERVSLRNVGADFFENGEKSMEGLQVLWVP